MLANRVPLEIVSIMPSVRKHLAREKKEKGKSADELLDKWDDVSDDDPNIYNYAGSVRESDWQTIEKILPLLEKAEEVSKALEGSKAVTVSCVLPKLGELLDCADEQVSALSDAILDSADAEVARKQALAFAEEFRKELNSRVDIRQIPERPSIWWLAAYLDPRFRSFRWVPQPQREAARLRVQQWLYNELCNLPEAFASEPAAPADGSKKRKAGEQPAGANKRSKYEGEEDGDEGIPNPVPTLLMELQQYHMRKAFACEPLGQWRIDEKDFPHIAQIVRKILCCPASSAPSERVFSAAELLISALRSSLKDSNASELMMVNRNQHLLPEFQQLLAEEAKAASSSSSASASGK
jgi:hypothetical protein